VLAGTGPRREEALARLHGLLLRIARGEVARRGPRLRLTGPELDDLAYQAAADALVAITDKLGQFRGESWFTTWAYKFVILEVSAKIGRHFWRHPSARLDAEAGTGCRTGSASTPRRRPSGGTCWPRCAGPWTRS
jgi:RNA polymerase sigma-70 factor (ECF subfamily)